MSDWARKEVELFTKQNGCYDSSCARSALKAYMSLVKDGHSGSSISTTKSILVRLIEGKPLSPITEDDFNYSEVSGLSRQEGEKVYQCPRMSSLFKRVFPDGKVEYNDIDRSVGVEGDNNWTYHSGLIDRIINEKYPISLPYFPSSRPFVVHTKEYLSNRKNGDFDTIWVRYYITPDGEKVEVNRYFFETFDNEITENEFNELVQKHLERKRRELLDSSSDNNSNQKQTAMCGEQNNSEPNV